MRQISALVMLAPTQTQPTNIAMRLSLSLPPWLLFSFSMTVMVSLLNAQQVGLKVDRLEYDIVRNRTNGGGKAVGEHVTSVHYVGPDRRERTEQFDGPRSWHTAVITDPRTGTMLQLDLKNKTVRQGKMRTRGVSDPPATGASVPEQCCRASASREKLDTQVIAGLECKGTRTTGALRGMTLEVFGCRDLISKRSVIGRLSTFNSKGALTSQETLTRIDHGVTASASLFEVPPGFRTLDPLSSHSAIYNGK